MVESSVGTRPDAIEGNAPALASQLGSDRRRHMTSSTWSEKAICAMGVFSLLFDYRVGRDFPSQALRLRSCLGASDWSTQPS